MSRCLTRGRSPRPQSNLKARASSPARSPFAAQPGDVLQVEVIGTDYSRRLL
jgi:hypothetical protein